MNATIPEVDRLTRTYKYRLYPTRRQADALNVQLAFCCDLYNAALEQRRSAWREQGVSVAYYDQCRELTVVRRAGLAPEGMSSIPGLDALRRLDQAYAGFFRRVARGERPGYPRFRSSRRYDSLTWRARNGYTIGERLRLRGVGHVKVRWHRVLPPSADVRAVTVRRTAGGHWYACFTLTIPKPAPQPATGEAAGLDLGITTHTALSNGELLPGPRASRAGQPALRRAQRKVSRRERGSNRRRKAVVLAARHHERTRNRRKDHAHKLARELVQRFDLIAVEDLNVAGLARAMLAKDVNDQGWSEFVAHLKSKAEEAGREVVLVDPRNTSRMCSGCGAVEPKLLSERVHRCDCGLILDRDVNAARNVLALGLGLSLRARTGQSPLPEKPSIGRMPGLREAPAPGQADGEGR